MTKLLTYSKESEVVLDLTRAITQQVLETRGLLPSSLPDITTELGREQLKSEALIFVL